MPEFDAVFLQQQVGYLLDNNILQACVCGWIDVLGQEHRAELVLVEKLKGKTRKRFT